MAFAGRNEPCPCGSGRKYKRCCGFDRAAERSLEEQLGAVETLARLPFLSPRLVPDSDGYDAWVGHVLAGEREASTETAIAAVGDDELARIVSACLDLYPEAWEELAPRCGSDRDAVGALLGGVVAAGIRDHLTVERYVVELVEGSDDLSADPLEALSLCLDGDRLWSTADGAEADLAIAAIPDWADDELYDRRWAEILWRTADRLWTDWHRRRLARLVGRVEAQLPFVGFPRASGAIAVACERCATDADFRRNLAAELLGDMVGRDLLQTVRARFLAA